MADTKQIFTSDGRHRVAYEMALDMWKASNEYNPPKLADQEEFLQLVKACTLSLVHYQS